MIVHIQQRRSHIFSCCKTLSISTTLHYFIDNSLRDHFACFMMLGINFQDFRFEHPMLHYLRRKFNKITGNTSHSIIMDISKKSVQSMSELVENSFSLVNTQQGRLPICRFTEIKHSRHYRSYALTILIRLVAITTAPCTTTLSRTGKEVHIKYT